MKRIYDLGMDTNQISLSVTVGTVGIAHTRVNIARSGGQNTNIAESNVESGNIPEKNIGNASELRNSYIVIHTMIDFSNIEKELWPNQKEKLIIRYYLNGGFSGSQEYNHDTDDVNSMLEGRILSIIKPIELK